MAAGAIDEVEKSVVWCMEVQGRMGDASGILGL
jgi:hypothetical protein